MTVCPFSFVHFRVHLKISICTGIFLRYLLFATDKYNSNKEECVDLDRGRAKRAIYFYSIDTMHFFFVKIRHSRKPIHCCLFLHRNFKARSSLFRFDFMSKSPQTTRTNCKCQKCSFQSIWHTEKSNHFTHSFLFLYFNQSTFFFKFSRFKAYLRILAFNIIILFKNEVPLT